MWLRDDGMGTETELSEDDCEANDALDGVGRTDLDRRSRAKLAVARVAGSGGRTVVGRNFGEAPGCGV